MTIIRTKPDTWAVIHTSGRKRGSPGTVTRKAPRQYQAHDKHGQPVGPVTTSAPKAAQHLTRKAAPCPTP